MTSTWDHKLKYFTYESTSVHVFHNMKWKSFDQIHHLHIDISSVWVLWLVAPHNDDRSHWLTGCHFLTWFTVHNKDHKGRWTTTWEPPVTSEKCSIIINCLVEIQYHFYLIGKIWELVNRKWVNKYCRQTKHQKMMHFRYGSSDKARSFILLNLVLLELCRVDSGMIKFFCTLKWSHKNKHYFQGQ
jgi:hypothetical protein